MGWGQGDSGEGDEEAGEEVRTTAGAGMRGQGRGDGRGLRWPRQRSLAGVRQGLPAALTWGPPAPDPTPRSGSSFLPCPCDFSTPESRSLRQVPPAASLPRGTPSATPLAAYYWLCFTPVTVSLAMAKAVHANHAASRRCMDWPARSESESLDSGSHWPRGLDAKVTRGGFCAE